MQFSTQKFVSNFIQSQFPQFYLEEGPKFIQFLQTYYEWLELQANPVGAARQLYNYRDIDNTENQFLSHFQKKYLYGIPYNVVVNLRFLLKHVLDVYRSKGTTESFQLLFRLIYDIQAQVYLPKNDILRLSDGTWQQPRYIEVAYNPSLGLYPGYQLIGQASQTSAVVESFITEAINGNIINTLYVSNITPRGAIFLPGEQVIVDQSGVTSGGLANAQTIILGSLSTINVFSSSPGFSVGNIVAVAHIDPSTGEVVSNGVDALLRVDSLQSGHGQMVLTLNTRGYGYTSNSQCLVYRGGPSDATGNGAVFSVSQLSFDVDLPYNTDILYDIANTVIGATTYGLPGNTSANVSSVMGTSLSFANNVFGSLAGLNVVSAGQDYNLNPKVFVESTLLGMTIPGNVSYTSTSNVVTFSGSAPDVSVMFFANSFIYLQANSSDSTTGEYQVIYQVTNSSSMILYGTPQNNATSSAEYALAPPVFQAQYAIYEPVVPSTIHTAAGLIANIGSTTSFGSDLVNTVSIISSGKAYLGGETLKAYLYGSLNTPLVANAGVGYANGDQIIFTGGGSADPAEGYVSTDGNGAITFTTLSNPGSSYVSMPTIQVASYGGFGGVLQTTIETFNTDATLTGQAVVAGIGIAPGYWTTTRGFLNSDKYIADNYYYQDFSYEIQTALTLDQYQGVLYDTFHVAGTQMFGKFLMYDGASSPIGVAYEYANT